MALDRHPSLSDDLPRLRAEAKHARERYRLYRAKAYGPRATERSYLRELDRTATLAEQRLARGARRRANAAPLPGVNRPPIKENQ